VNVGRVHVTPERPAAADLRRDPRVPAGSPTGGHPAVRVAARSGRQIDDGHVDRLRRITPRQILLGEEDVARSVVRHATAGAQRSPPPQR
jgi:hypothetical protein